MRRALMQPRLIHGRQKRILDIAAGMQRTEHQNQQKQAERKSREDMLRQRSVIRRRGLIDENQTI